MAVTEQSFTDAQRILYFEKGMPPKSIGGVALGPSESPVLRPCAYSKVVLDNVEYIETGLPGVFRDMGPADSFKGLPAPYGVVVGSEMRDVNKGFPSAPQGDNGLYEIHQYPGA